MKGKTLKEALEYTPGKPKEKFTTLSANERVKRLKQELADMENLMRTGVGNAASGSLAKGPASADYTDEYVPASKKVKKTRKHRERPPPPPPPRKEAPSQVDTARAPPPPPPPPKKPTETTVSTETAPSAPLQTRGVSAPLPETTPPVKEQSSSPVKGEKSKQVKKEEVPLQVINVEEKSESPKRKPLKKRILNEQYQTNDPFDSFGAAAPPPPPPPGQPRYM